VFDVFTQRRRHFELEREQVALAAAAVAARQEINNAELALGRLRLQAQTQIKATTGRTLMLLTEYLRGLEHGLQDPAITARLDRRATTAVDELTSSVDHIVAEGLTQLGQATVLDETSVRAEAVMAIDTPVLPSDDSGTDIDTEVAA